jgi:dienelactone hydrolase
VWYTSDGAFADQAVACAIQNKHGDPTHIHTAGYSAGGLQTVWMWYARSGYLASVISYSGGSGGITLRPCKTRRTCPPQLRLTAPRVRTRWGSTSR